MDSLKVLKLKCPKCSTSLDVTIKPLQELVTCTKCNIKFKVVKELQLMARPNNPQGDNQCLYTYFLEKQDYEC